ncbi:hypothetical protein L228DRAFT_266599 [Xylona heveae TC161]|uniref:Uncharacterized protein n=1 Tax=Xylona heveae (strain CBS 132557 / TC161) TaxID=1328760 RepID=A0A165I218_XYLHT|nr:hypothetical protein L228DRAFT_266599 [Xylona heveae TC161]KZF24250.1 hypothetical protein L228DRAFT_266599 [Xylona heveae TC161]
MSRAAKMTLLGTSVFAASIVVFVHYAQKAEKAAMHAGVVRDVEQQRFKKEQRERLADFEMQKALEQQYRKVQNVSDGGGFSGLRSMWEGRDPTLLLFFTIVLASEDLQLSISTRYCNWQTNSTTMEKVCDPVFWSQEFLFHLPAPKHGDVCWGVPHKFYPMPDHDAEIEALCRQMPCFYRVERSTLWPPAPKSIKSFGQYLETRAERSPVPPNVLEYKVFVTFFWDGMLTEAHKQAILTAFAPQTNDTAGTNDEPRAGEEGQWEDASDVSSNTI